MQFDSRRQTHRIARGGSYRAVLPQTQPGAGTEDPAATGTVVVASSGRCDPAAT